MSSFSAAVLFDKKFTTIETTIEFNPEWNNGTGYLNYCVSGEFAPVVPSGEMIKFITNNQRKGIIVGTMFGNVVVYQRYSNGDGGVHVSNMTMKLYNTKLFTEGRIDDDQMEFLIGGVYYGEVNVGEFIENLHKVFKEHA